MTPELRALFPITKRVVYLNHAAVSPPPIITIEAIENQLRDVVENGSLHFRSWIEVKNRTRHALAELLGAKAEQVAFTRNTSDGLSTVANGYRWQPGNNIVTFRGEFPSNIYPWRRLRDAYDVEVRMCNERGGGVDLEQLESLVDNQTRIIAISHVQYASGYRVDLERLGQLARKSDALLVVDVIQSLGVVPINVDAELIDVAAGACHKWLLNPEGVGYLYISDRARERIEPTLVGWGSVPEPEDYNNFNQPWNRGALAWETGTGPTALIHGLDASLHLLMTSGTTTIEQYLENLSDYFCQQLDATKYEIVSSRRRGEKSQIVCIRHRHGVPATRLYAELKKKGIVTAPRGDRLRIAPHFYNTTAELDFLIKSLP
ncbi:MAG: aminotransferase class V-fold PLP-dependent enzyme [Pyrinomonadaceae bacterium]